MAERTWQRISEALQERIPKQSFDTWIRPTRLSFEDDQEIRVSVPNSFFKEWIEKHYTTLINEIQADLRVQKRVAFLVNRDLLPGMELASEPSLTTSAPSLNTRPPDRSPLVQATLNPKFTFNNFVVGPSNQFAHAAARAVAEVLYTAYNPLFIYGGVGLGKTHLMHAIGHHILSVDTGIRICFVSSERFMNEMISSIRYDRMPQFRSKYRNMDVLMVDDIQFFSDKERTQEEFFHTFNALFEMRKQLVFSSDRYPKEIPNLEERLCSRFEWGLLADIQPPDLETKVAILRKKAEMERIDLPDDVSLFLAERIRSNVRELEGSLIRLGAYASLSGRPITVSLAQEVLKEFLDARETVITMEGIQKKVCEAYDVRLGELKSKRRNQSVVLPRQVAMYLCRHLTGKSLPEIGKAFGGKDHTTVIHACRAVEARLEKDPEFAQVVNRLRRELSS